MPVEARCSRQSPAPVSALIVGIKPPMCSRWLLALLCLLPLAAPAAEGVDLLAPPPVELGTFATVLSETDRAWTPEAAMDALQRDGQPGRGKVLNLGIGRPTLWLQLSLRNPTATVLERQVLIGQSWLDHVEVWVFAADGQVRHWQTGDEVAGQPGLDDVHGYVFAHGFAPGSHRLLVRVETADQLTVNLRLRTPADADAEGRRDRYLYGFLYGFMLSLVAYNLMLFVGLRRKVYVLYALYLLSFLLLNLAYTGRGALWLWGEWVFVQRFSNVSLIVLMPSAGLLFARAFLELPRVAPRLDRWVRFGYWIGPLLLLATILSNAYEAAVWLAFVVLGLFIAAMVALGVHAVRRGHPAARYFLLGAVCSMLGTALTEFSVWGQIPFSVWAYRGIELGMMLDATLLALALTQFVRTEVAQRQDAERVARADPLTLLENRRGFRESAEVLLATTARTGQPLTAVLVDIDHFKRVNDRHGHPVGDRVLVEVAECMRQALRIGDRCARWGGEEFVLLLPDTDLDAARGLAERLRQRLQDTSIHGVQPPLRITASLGVAVLQPNDELDDLVARADAALYRAKENGRNRVEVTV